jgi:hypothetical protein
MSAQWYFAEQGKAVGPVTDEQIRSHALATPDKAVMVWKAGMAEWVDARHIPELASSGVRKGISLDRAELARRARHEFIEYAGISAYLFVCFGALMVYKTAVLRSIGVEFAPMGLALIKALISAKFIMVLQALKLDRRILQEQAPYLVILQKAALFTLFLIMLTVIEELLVGHLHGKESREILAELAGGTVPQALSVGLLMFLIMIPFFAFRQSGIDFWKAPEK